jgi:tight adherence protein B
MLTIVLVFLVIFALVVLSISLGTGMLEAQRKKRVQRMLQTAEGGLPVSETKVLVEQAKPSSEVLARLMERFNIGRRMAEHLQQAGMSISLNGLLVLMLALGALGALLGYRFPVLISRTASIAAGAAVLGSVPYLYVMNVRRKRLAAFEEQFPEALDFLARAMRAGHAFTISLEMLAEESHPPLSPEIRKVFNEHNLGLPIETALKNLVTRVPLLDVRFFVSAVLLQRETGGNLAEVLTKLAHIIRERFKLKGQVRAASAHGRITGAVLTIMPVVLMLGLLAIAPGYLQSLANDPDGKYIILGAVVGLLLGHFTIRRIVNIKV